MNILENIEAIRKERGIKQSVIAEQLGVKQPAYSNYINRSTDIWFSKLSQIANIFEMPVIDIITYPQKYVIETAQIACKDCEQKDLTIKNLNNYIKILESKMK
jgi:transcriptional regulator with XRE-family HTH domain